MKKIILTTLAAGVLSLGLAGQSAIAGEIISVDKNFASPIISLSGYNKVYIQDLDLSHTKIISPPWIEKDSFHWKVTDSNKAHLKDRFKKGVEAGLTENNGRYEVVGKEGKGVLIVDVEIISFMPYALQEDKEVTTKGAGEFHLSVHLRDGKSRSLIHIFEGTVAIGSDYQPNTEMARAKEAKELFKAWGKSLRKKLDAAN
ncbi:DUF3313 family protein [Colwellia psychrerythraea]|uniref:DUF3313 domain-containing protein n=1 Tax=Colwellia psychrerythraea TaxID=28229 RepID=A0A099KM86_COLPS|nr:DUF3313 family protein [Colwellia psychrerythraea]KGJ91879.1 Protein of unknown function DUF3313 [Colwellia psychrerythraea]